MYLECLSGIERTLNMRDDLVHQARMALNSIPDSDYLAYALDDMACRER